MATFHENLVQSFNNFKTKFVTPLIGNVHWYASSSTSSGTSAKVATAASGLFPTTLAAGCKVSVKFTNTNTTTSPTLNVNSTGAYSIKAYGSTAPKSWWKAGSVVDFTFDGSYWIMSSVGSNEEVKTVTLSAGSTTVTFTGIPTSGNYTIDVYTSIAGVDYTGINTATSGSITYTFPSQQSNMTVWLVIKER